MIVVANRLRMPLEYADRLETAFRQRGEMRGVPGFIAFDLLKRENAGDQAEYVVYTRWSDRASYEAWLESDAFARAHSGTNPNSPVKSELEVYEVVHHVE